MNERELRSAAATPRRTRVLLTTEGTYPHTIGGVSTWCQNLVESLGEIDFTVFAHMTSPFVPEAYERPANVELVGVPIWGVEEPAEFNPKLSPRRVIVLSAMMDEPTARRWFCPLLREMLEMLHYPQRFDAERFGAIVESMYDYFRDHDYRGTFRTRAVWETCRDTWLEACGVDPDDDDPDADFDPEANPNPHEIVRRLGQLRRPQPADDEELKRTHRLPRLFEATEAMRLVYRLLTPLNYDLPEADLVHATAASFCGLAGIVKRRRDGTPLLVTEHGVFMREQMLYLGRVRFPFHLRKFFIQFVSAVSRAVYHHADQVSPVCAYNARWEVKNGAHPDRIRVIYNGVEEDRFRPMVVERPAAPTVVMVSRVDALKDLETALRVAARVRERVPEVRFLHYGPEPDAAYATRCRELWRELGLETTFEWRGMTNDAAAAYNQGDVVLLTSISEAFPYTVIEGMMCGRPVVSTNVGGVPEAIGELGATARIRDVDGLARGVEWLLRLDAGDREQLQRSCRERTVRLFTQAASIAEYRIAYDELIRQARIPGTTPLVASASAATPTAVPPPLPLPTSTVATRTLVRVPATADEVRLGLGAPLPEARLAAVAAAGDHLEQVEAIRRLTQLLRTDPDTRVRLEVGVALRTLIGLQQEAG
ncbi:MAG: GT4 family glycosyltransferase PelF [Actinobacteria bacterium]|jgi:glycosyltransferase involved in cell wall biosynthesis|nr:GT4 family glycosyltransferase PelF [Actinomycetota bacterium]